MRVLVTGSREWRDPVAIHERMIRLPDSSTIVHGGARGADTMAEHQAKIMGFTIERFLPDWETYGRRAGIIRNREMLDTWPDIVLAFWDGQSPGTADCVAEAQRRGIPVEVISP